MFVQPSCACASSRYVRLHRADDMKALRVIPDWQHSEDADDKI
jgi:hypothetical protein